MVHAVDNSLHHTLVRDCFRLGRYSKERNRPILVKFACARNVSNVLFNKKNLSQSIKYSKISIKQDMSKEERQKQSLLLKERRTLINSGILRKDIKIRGHPLLVKNKVVGSIIDSKYVAHSIDSTLFRSSSGETSLQTSNKPLQSLNQPFQSLTVSPNLSVSHPSHTYHSQ